MLCVTKTMVCPPCSRELKHEQVHLVAGERLTQRAEWLVHQEYGRFLRQRPHD